MQNSRSHVLKVMILVLCGLPFALSTAVAQKFPTPCGDSNPAYTADRTVYTPGGTIKTKFYSAGGFQREDQNPSMYSISDLSKSVTYLINLKAKSYVERPMPKPNADKDKLRQDTYTDRQPKDDGTTVVESGVDKDGKKVWFARTTCGPDGVFLQQELKVPGPNKKMVTIKIVQDNIKVGDVPADTFQIPDGLKKAN